MSGNEKEKEQELDDFWEIGSILPKRKIAPMRADTETVEIEVGEPCGTEFTRGYRPEPERAVGQRIPPRPLPSKPKKTLFSYEPESALLRKVTVFANEEKSPITDPMLRDAQKLYPVRGTRAEPVPFFSFHPMYEQMSTNQLEYYLWWRERVRAGEYPEVEYSYLRLNVIEWILLSESLDPVTVRDALVALWVHYREAFPLLDRCMPDWICDLSLIHRLPPPQEITWQMMRTALDACWLKEFFVRDGEGEGFLNALLLFSNHYDYQKSRYCTPEREKIYDQAVRVALRCAIEATGKDGTYFSETGYSLCQKERIAFSEILSSARLKKKILVEYHSFSRYHELRYLITDTVKYAENQLRSYLGIRSRLSVYSVPENVKKRIDAAFAELLPTLCPRPQKAKEAPAAYEALYDLPAKPFSREEAMRIESASWDTTRSLVEAFGEDDPVSEPTLPGNETQTSPGENRLPQSPGVPEPASESPSPEEAFRPYLGFLRTLGKPQSEQRIAAQALGKLPDVLAEEINGIAFDVFGDVLAEQTDDGYDVLPDYREEFDTLLQKLNQR